MDTLSRRIERLQQFEFLLRTSPHDSRAEHIMQEALLVLERILVDFPSTRETLRKRLPHLFTLAGENQN
jgi:hypothetical protein